MASPGPRGHRLFVSVIGLLAIIVASPAGLARAQSAEPAVDQISIGTGSPTGIYFAAGNAICRLVNRQASAANGVRPKRRLTCSAPATPGSIFNLGELRTRNLTFAIVQSDWQYHAFRGSSRFSGQAFPSLRSVLSLHPEAFQILVGRGTSISGFEGLMGKRVALGEKGSGTRSTFDVLMQAYGVDPSFFARADETAAADQNQALCDGNIDAIAYAIGIPSGPVGDATASCGATLVNLAGAPLTKLVKENPYYGMVTIPRGSFAGMDEPVTTFGVLATLVTRGDTPDEVVYDLTRTVIEGLESLRPMHRAFANLDADRMVSDGLTAPLHSGALRYYIERGLISPRGR